MPKSCGGDTPKLPHGYFVMPPWYTAKRCSKNYECVIMKVKKLRWFHFQPENATKAFGGGAPPGPAWELTALPQTPSWTYRVGVGTRKGDRKDTGHRRGEGRGGRGERQEGQEGRQGEEGGQEGEGEGKGESRLTVISKSRRLWVIWPSVYIMERSCVCLSIISLWRILCCTDVLPDSTA